MAHIHEALALALEYIAMNDFIDDRQTMFSGRLVCRSWRNSNAFSGKITSVTLHTLEDLHCVARFYPCTLSQRPPWRRLEDVNVFPNVSTLKVLEHPEDTLTDLDDLEYEEAQKLCWTCKQFDIEISGVSAQNAAKLSSLLSCVGVTTSLHLEAFTDNKFTFLNDLLSLSGLTKLVLCVDLFEDMEIQRLSVLCKLGQLRHLELQGIHISHSAQCVSLASTLSHLTRLDFSMWEEDGTESSFTDLNVKLQALVPRILHSYSTKISWEKDATEYKITAEGSGSAGLQVVKGELHTRVHQSGSRIVSSELSQLLRHGPPSQCLKLNLYVDVAVAEERYAIDLAQAADIPEVRVTYQYACATQRPRQTDIPVFAVRPDLCLSTRTLALEFGRRWSEKLQLTDPISLFKHLHSLFPHLQSLSISVASSKFCQFSNVSYLQELTKLTELSLKHVSPSDSNVNVWSCLPSSLRRLQLHPLYTVSGPRLLHLTYLKVCKVTSDLSVQSLYTAPAPLKWLDIASSSYGSWDFQALASAFPQLEQLNSCINLTDLSPLSCLPCLRKLTLMVIPPKDQNRSFTRLMGLNTLTAVWELEVDCETGSLECLSELAALTQLRRLIYTIKPTLRTKDTSKIFSDKIKQLYTALPNARLRVFLQPRRIGASYPRAPSPGD